MANIIKTTLEDANDVLTYNNRASFPSSGESGKLYIAADTKYTYFWNGSSYVETRGSGYAASSHTHDDRYYTESEVDSKLGSKASSSEVVKKSGDTMSGNLEFSSISYSNAPVSSKGLTWRGGTDAAEIFYRLDANDAGRLVFKTHDDDNCNFVWENSVQGQWMSLSKDGTLAVKGDITSKGNKVALDKDVIKLTGEQNISGIKRFNNKIINTYLQQGIIDTHPENNGTIISYYTNDLGYLFERGGSCVAKNITQNKTITVPADVFDCSPSYWYLTLTNTSDVVQIIIKASSTYYYTTRGGIGFGASAWRAKDVKIEVGYSATNTGTAASPDSDIVWITKINVTNQTEGLVSGMITGPHASEGGKSNDDCEWSYMRLTLTNWATIYPRIAQIFSITYNSRGLHNTFLSKNGGYVYGNILPSNNNRYLGNGSENWAAVYARYFYENGTSLADKYAAKTHTHTSINTAFVFNNNDMPEAEGSAISANLAGTTKAHQISFYRNGLSIPYQMDDSNDGGILRCRGTSESNTIFELATWDDYGTGETIQFNYYPTTSQITPTYSVTVPKKTGTIALTSDIPETASSSTLGLVKSSTTGTAANRDYKVQVNDDGTMKVNVPWTDNNTTYSASTGLSLNGTTFSVKTGYTTDVNNRNYKVAADSSGNLYVNVPWSSSGTLDTSLSSTSTNALQNKAIYSVINNSLLSFDNTYFLAGVNGSWRIKRYGNGNSLDIRYGQASITTQEKTYSISFPTGKSMPNSNYCVVCGISGIQNQWFWTPIVKNKTTSGFQVYLRGNSGNDNTGNLVYIAVCSRSA